MYIKINSRVWIGPVNSNFHFEDWTCPLKHVWEVTYTMMLYIILFYLQVYSRYTMSLWLMVRQIYSKLAMHITYWCIEIENDSLYKTDYLFGRMLFHIFIELIKVTLTLSLSVAWHLNLQLSMPMWSPLLSSQLY